MFDYVKIVKNVIKEILKELEKEGYNINIEIGKKGEKDEPNRS